MKATEEVGNTKIGEEDEEEGYHAKSVVDDWWFFYPREVEEKGIDEHGDKRPGLFGVPSPIASPGHVRPNGADEDTGGQAEQSGVKQYLW